MYCASGYFLTAQRVRYRDMSCIELRNVVLCSRVLFSDISPFQRSSVWIFCVMLGNALFCTWLFCNSGCFPIRSNVSVFCAVLFSSVSFRRVDCCSVECFSVENNAIKLCDILSSRLLGNTPTSQRIEVFDFLVSRHLLYCPVGFVLCPDGQT